MGLIDVMGESQIQIFRTSGCMLAAISSPSWSSCTIGLRASTEESLCLAVKLAEEAEAVVGSPTRSHLSDGKKPIAELKGGLSVTAQLYHYKRSHVRFRCQAPTPQLVRSHICFASESTTFTGALRLSGLFQIWSTETDDQFTKARNWRALIEFYVPQSLAGLFGTKEENSSNRGLPGWGGRIRTAIWWNENPLRSVLAMPRMDHSRLLYHCGVTTRFVSFYMSRLLQREGRNPS